MSAGNSTMSSMMSTAISEISSKAYCHASSSFAQNLTIDEIDDSGCPGAKIDLSNSLAFATVCNASAQACQFAKIASNNEQLAHAIGIKNSDSVQTDTYNKTSTKINSKCGTKTGVKQGVHIKKIKLHGSLCSDQTIKIGNSADGCTSCTTATIASMSNNTDAKNKADDTGNLLLVVGLVVGGVLVMKLLF